MTTSSRTIFMGFCKYYFFSLRKHWPTSGLRSNLKLTFFPIYNHDPSEIQKLFDLKINLKKSIYEKYNSTVKAVSPIVSETIFVRTKFLFFENFLQNGSPISAILFVKTVLPYLIENDINTYNA